MSNQLGKWFIVDLKKRTVTQESCSHLWKAGVQEVMWNKNGKEIRRLAF